MSDPFASAAPHRHRLDPARTTVTFRTRHLFGLASVSGSMSLLSGSAVVDLDEHAPISVEAELDASSFQSGSAARDAAVLSRRFLDASQHPVIRFRSTGVERSGEKWLVHGRLTVRGSSAPVALLLDAAEQGDAVSVHGTATIDRFALGITAARGLAGRHLTVEIEATARRADGIGGPAQDTDSLIGDGVDPR